MQRIEATARCSEPIPTSNAEQSQIFPDLIVTASQYRCALYDAFATEKSLHFFRNAIGL
jgi:hypothetical protein